MAKLKIQGEDFASLKDAVTRTLATADAASVKEHGMTASEFYRVNEKTHMRFRWDVLWASKWFQGENMRHVYDELNCNDTHVDSALKAIIGSDFAN